MKGILPGWAQVHTPVPLGAPLLRDGRRRGWRSAEGLLPRRTRPDEGSDPAEKREAEEQIEEKDRPGLGMLAAHGDKDRQEVHEQEEAQDDEKDEVRVGLWVILHGTASPVEGC